MSLLYWGIIAGVFAMIIVLFVSIGIYYRMPEELDQGNGSARSDEPISSFPSGNHAAVAPWERAKTCRPGHATVELSRSQGWMCLAFS